MQDTNALISWYTSIPEIAILAFSGKDAAKLLQGQTTCDIVGLPPGQTTLGAVCTPKGRAIALFRVLRTEDRILLLLPAELLETVRKRLSLYVLRDDVKIEDVSGRWAVFGLFGGKAPGALQALGLPPLAQENEAEGQGGFCTSFYAIRIPDPSTSRFMVLIDAAKSSAIGRFMEGHGLAHADPSLWQLEDIRSGIPVITTGTTEEFVPQMLNLDLLGGISFKKGCYTGQEVVARTHYLGNLKRRMIRMKGIGEPIPQAGDSLFVEDGERQSAGTVVCSAPDPEEGFEVLAVINLSLGEDRNAVFATSAGARLILSTLPYPLPETPPGAAT